MHVHAEISGLAPGDHGFHIHEFGVWSEDGMAAGGHFNPTHQKHAGIDTPKRHIGDLGNITANANGNATLDLDDPSLMFRGPTSIIGRGLVVHEKADDLKTQPTGNAGGRVPSASSAWQSLEPWFPSRFRDNHEEGKAGRGSGFPVLTRLFYWVGMPWQAPDQGVRQGQAGRAGPERICLIGMT